MPVTAVKESANVIEFQTTRIRMISSARKQRMPSTDNLNGLLFGREYVSAAG